MMNWGPLRTQEITINNNNALIRLDSKDGMKRRVDRHATTSCVIAVIRERSEVRGLQLPVYFHVPA
jgi:uncharacterized protein (DUF2267 family)